MRNSITLFAQIFSLRACYKAACASDILMSVCMSREVSGGRLTANMLDGQVSRHAEREQDQDLHLCRYRAVSCNIIS